MPSENIAVKSIVRCRPLLADETSHGCKNIVKIAGNKVVVDANGKENSYGLDGIYVSDVNNSVIYKENCDSLLHRALEGYNVGLLAFGATNAGKTYLMVGNNQDEGIIPQLCNNLYTQINQRSNKEFFITVSYLEVLDGEMMDLLNPHTNEMKIREHPNKGIYVDGLSELVCHNQDELKMYFDQGTRARKMAASDMKAHRTRAHSIFNINIEQKEKQSSKVGIRSTITLADLAGCEVQDADADTLQRAETQAILNVITALADSKKKGGHVPFRDSKITRLLQEMLSGNTITMMLAVVSPADKCYKQTLSTLEHAQMIRNVKNKVKLNVDDTQTVINELRNEISKLKDKIAASNEPKQEDVSKMEELVQDLQVAKKFSISEREKLSTKYAEDRKINLSKKGILEWVMGSDKQGSVEVQEKLLLLQKEKDQLTIQYKDKRKIIGDLKEELQNKITEYSKFTESGQKSESETKSRVNAIKTLKDKLKEETEKIKRIKDELNVLLDKQQTERQNAQAQISALKGNANLRQKVEVEERQRLEAENKTLIDEELDRIQMEIESKKADVQMQIAEGKTYTVEEGKKLEIELAELQAEKSVVTLKLHCLEKEKAHVSKELDEIYQLHHDELELQQLQHYQTFRQYRQMFEEQKVAIEQRYRVLLEEALQDAVYLSARNQEILQEQAPLKQQNAEMKDVITKLGGKIPPLEN
ncbi:hypothetical protein LOTGIDRAFT_235687 [Lottia gigantea]|uniref:Kinesin motor domain-containing protein n=1 Tax=Lottia gigantea TaxID=225164 RepID=V3ZTP8_LOTGI|nr:hypothetical protein LOTGIDRAFT_235687 [Lottia gigantea]ESO85910.1 hypothetical protein LOTGIDRAFT_235687 [Lottia gigantea]